MASVTLFNKYVVSKSYCNDISIMDDTYGTNIYDLPAEILLTVDENFKSQISAFRILKDKTTESFIGFLNDVKEKQEEIRILVVDRLYAQSEAIKNIYPNCIIVFCKVHIRRDLINQFGYRSEIVKKFDDVHYNYYILCESFIKYLNDFKVQLQQENKNGVQMINDL